VAGWPPWPCSSPAAAGVRCLTWSGFAGTTVPTRSQAILSDRSQAILSGQHGQPRDRALCEATVGAAGGAVLAPLLLGVVLLLAGLWLARAPESGTRRWW
jgi:hypothetical protein